MKISGIELLRIIDRVLNYSGENEQMDALFNGTGGAQ
jgi:hypothetical protein